VADQQIVSRLSRSDWRKEPVSNVDHVPLVELVLSGTIAERYDTHCQDRDDNARDADPTEKRVQP
jgi:hypothetical protein